MKRILVVDWLDKFGGAERVIASLQSVFRFRSIYGLVNIMSSKDQKKIFGIDEVVIKTTSLQQFKNMFRLFFFSFHYYIKKLKLDESANTIVSSSHAVAKGVQKKHNQQLHISYFQARNFKYIWEDASLYFGSFLFVVRPLLNYLKKVDFKQAQNPDYIVSNSEFVRQWVLDKYQRNSVVIYPPVDLEEFPFVDKKEDYYVAVGRIVTYKRFDLIVDAFNTIDKKLIIVGDGPELKNLKKKANANIHFTGFLDSKEVHKYISSAKAFIHIGIEDFGIAPIEAQSCGTPVIAYKAGGIIETVLDQKTGVLFDHQTIDSLKNALIDFESKSWNHHEIHQQAQKFSKNRFETEIETYIEECERNFFKQAN